MAWPVMFWVFISKLVFTLHNVQYLTIYMRTGKSKSNSLRKVNYSFIATNNLSMTRLMLFGDNSKTVSHILFLSKKFNVQNHNSEKLIYLNQKFSKISLL